MFDVNDITDLDKFNKLEHLAVSKPKKSLATESSIYEAKIKNSINYSYANDYIEKARTMQSHGVISDV